MYSQESRQLGGQGDSKKKGWKKVPDKNVKDTLKEEYLYIIEFICPNMVRVKVIKNSLQRAADNICLCPLFGGSLSLITYTCIFFCSTWLV